MKEITIYQPKNTDIIIIILNNLNRWGYINQFCHLD